MKCLHSSDNIKKKKYFKDLKSAIKIAIEDKHSFGFYYNADGVFYFFKDAKINLIDQQKTGYAFFRNGAHMVEILDAANYLIQLYYKTGEKYQVTRTKIEKLLAIAALTEMRENRELFSEKIKINHCGVGYPKLIGFIPSDIIDGTKEPTDKTISTDDINESINPPIIYHSIDSVQENESIIDLLKSVFLSFGAQDALVLGKAFDAFKYDISSFDESLNYDCVSTEKATGYFQNLINSGNNFANEILRFICTYERKY